MFQNIFKTKSDILENPLSTKSERVSDQKDREKYILKLTPSMRFLAESFYAKLDALLPRYFHLRYDSRAPRSEEFEERGKTGAATSLSLELAMDREARFYKYGTGRVELRDGLFFCKTVTWMTPKDFLHQRTVYDHIKKSYQDCELLKNRSQSRNGFTVKNKKHIITLEVFGENPKRGYLACDITLNGGNLQIARDRVQHFLEFYAELYNYLGNEDLHFRPHRGNVDALSHIELDLAVPATQRSEPKWLG